MSVILFFYSSMSRLFIINNSDNSRWLIKDLLIKVKEMENTLWRVTLE